jgi:hypothetical protein
MFLTILAAGLLLVAIQGICAYLDGYFTQAQMQAHGVWNGYSFLEHGGMWADVFVISPLVAHITGKYRLSYFSLKGLAILALAIALAIAGGIAYNKIGLSIPVAHSHDGRTTPAGWIHGIFMVLGFWIVGMFYLTPIDPPASAGDIVMVSLLLTPFCFLGVADFNHRWVFYRAAQIQVAAQIVIIWIVTAVKLWHR